MIGVDRLCLGYGNMIQTGLIRNSLLDPLYIHQEICTHLIFTDLIPTDVIHRVAAAIDVILYVPVASDVILTHVILTHVIHIDGITYTGIHTLLPSLNVDA